MKLLTYLQLGISFSIALVIFYFYSIKQISREENVEIQVENEEHKQQTESFSFTKSGVIVAVVACGDRLHETLNMLKSALMFSKERMNFIVVSDDNLIDAFKEKLTEWQIQTNNGFGFKIFPLTFPEQSAEEWKRLFKPCAAQRLFLPDLLEDIDSILYMDTDTLFLTPVETVWMYFRRFNSTQMAALAPEHEDRNIGWYNRFAKHPYYGELGVNSGVMLMNLTRMRQFRWTEYVVPIYRKYKLQITWGDQDIINILFHYHPGKLFVYSCRFNYRPDHCMYTSICEDAKKYGVAIVHGSRGFFHSEKQPAFKLIYKAVDEFQFGGDVVKEFYQPLEAYLDDVQDTNCGHVRDLFLKNLRRYIDVDRETR